jgi:3-methylcrotonyl-CoA carboxylase alpha subunit
MKYTVTVDGEVFEIEIGPEGRVWVNHEPYEIDLQHVGGTGEYSMLMNNRSYEIHVDDNNNGHRWVTVSGRPYRTWLQRGHGIPERGRLATEEVCGGPGDLTTHVEIRAPLPGLLVELYVREGEHVEEQQVVAVLESMKMNLELRAPREAVVCEIRATPGRQVAQYELLAILGPEVSLRSSEGQ